MGPFGILGPFFFTEIYDPITLYVGDQFWHSSELTGRFVKHWTLLFAGSIEPYIRLGQILSFLPLLVYTSGGYIIRILKNIKWIWAYIIVFILTGPLIYLFDGWFDFEDMLEELFEEGLIFAGFLGLVPVFLFHMYLKVKERS